MPHDEVRKILEDLADNIWKCNPSDIDQAEASIQAYYKGLLPKEREGIYCGEVDCQSCEEINDGFNQAIAQMRERIRGKG